VSKWTPMSYFRWFGVCNRMLQLTVRTKNWWILSKTLENCTLAFQILAYHNYCQNFTTAQSVSQSDSLSVTVTDWLTDSQSVTVSHCDRLIMTDWLTDPQSQSVSQSDRQTQTVRLTDSQSVWLTYSLTDWLCQSQSVSHSQWLTDWLWLWLTD